MLLYKLLATLIAQLCDALRHLSDNEYSQFVAIMFEASIGQHVRHIVELFEELFADCETGTVNYDNRRREYVLETNRIVAIESVTDVTLPKDFGVSASTINHINNYHR